MCWTWEVSMPLVSKAWCCDKIVTLNSYFQNINFYEEYFFQGITTVLTCFMSLLRTRHFNSRLLQTLKVIAYSWVLTTFHFVTALYELILIDIQLSSYACLFIGATICLLLGLGNAISTEVSRTECVYYIYAYGDPIPWWNDTAAYTHTSCFLRPILGRFVRKYLKSTSASWKERQGCWCDLTSSVRFTRALAELTYSVSPRGVWCIYRTYCYRRVVYGIIGLEVWIDAFYLHCHCL
jgi:hypothetical protein